MIRSVVRVYGWTPKDFESLYLDDMDFFGLEYWFNDAVEFNNEIKVAANNDNNLKDG